MFVIFRSQALHRWCRFFRFCAEFDSFSSSESEEQDEGLSLSLVSLTLHLLLFLLMILQKGLLHLTPAGFVYLIRGVIIQLDSSPGRFQEHR